MRFYQSAALRLRANMTDAEMALWRRLRNKSLGVKFRRQQLIGRYIVDFVCHNRRLVVEVDGGQHARSTTDEIRDRFFREQGYVVMRFWNNEVLQNPAGVVAAIAEAISTLPLVPSHRGRG